MDHTEVGAPRSSMIRVGLAILEDFPNKKVSFTPSLQGRGCGPGRAPSVHSRRALRRAVFMCIHSDNGHWVGATAT